MVGFDPDADSDAPVADLRDRVARVVGERPVSAEELAGGRIGTVVRVDFAGRESLVAKTGPTPLDVEAAMLRRLDAAGLRVPTVRHADPDLLVMEFVAGDGRITPDVERDAADRLAALHGVTADAAGFGFDTLDGPLAQPNPWTDSWIAFYRDHRLLYAAERAADDAADAGREGSGRDPEGDGDGALPAATLARVRDAAADLGDLLVEPPAASLLHGDVWTENVVVADGEIAAFLDPAIYYGHPEVELAYVDLFGSFGDAFFERYDERRGIADGFFERRADAYALHPLLVHVRVFGAEYVPRVERTLDRLGY